MMCDEREELEAAERCLRKHAGISSEKCDEEKIELNQKYRLAKSERASTVYYNEFCSKAQKLSTCLQATQLDNCPAENVNRLLEFERNAYPSFQTFLHQKYVTDMCTRLESFLTSSQAEHPDGSSYPMKIPFKIFSFAERTVDLSVEKFKCCRDKLAQVHMTTHKDNIPVGFNLVSSESFDYLIEMKLPECLNVSECNKSPLHSVFDYLDWMKTNEKPVRDFLNCSMSSNDTTCDKNIKSLMLSFDDSLTKRDFTEPCRNAKAFYQCAETNWRKICNELDVNMFFELEPMVLKRLSKMESSNSESEQENEGQLKMPLYIRKVVIEGVDKSQKLCAMTIVGAEQVQTCVDLQTYFKKSRGEHNTSVNANTSGNSHLHDDSETNACGFRKHILSLICVSLVTVFL